MIMGSTDKKPTQCSINDGSIKRVTGLLEQNRSPLSQKKRSFDQSEVDHLVGINKHSTSAQ
jgi:hypothetical protein